MRTVWCKITDRAPIMMKHMNEYLYICNLGFFNAGAVWLKRLIRNWETVDATVGATARGVCVDRYWPPTHIGRLCCHCYSHGGATVAWRFSRGKFSSFTCVHAIQKNIFDKSFFISKTFYCKENSIEYICWI
jgi:hypothetical protein